MGDLSKNFSQSEFSCKCSRWWCSGKRAPNPRLVKELQALRDSLGALRINSGNRCCFHNDSLPNSAKYSKHVKRMAVDIRSTRYTPKQIADFIDKKFPNSYGLGRYKNFTHFDVFLGGRRRWGRN